VRDLDPQHELVFRACQVPLTVRRREPESALTELDQLFEVTRLPEQAVGVPNHDAV
jgi:hypothetical protein